MHHRFHNLCAEHDLRLVLLALVLCLISTLATVLLLRQARDLEGKASQHWLMLAGIEAGFGVWATHFIIMLGYRPGVVFGYDITLTIVSLLVAIVINCIAFKLVLQRNSEALPVRAGLLAGLGMASMHYIGMYSIELPDDMHWNPAYVGVSLAAATIPIPFAMKLATKRGSVASLFGTGILITSAVAVMHFVSMAGLRLTPNLHQPDPMVIAPNAMAGIVTMISFILLAISLVSLIVDQRTRMVVAHSERQLAFLVHGISDYAIYMLDKSGHVVNWNAGAQRLKGYSETEAVGLPLATFYTPEDRARNLHETALAKALETGRYTGEGWRMCRDGSRFWAHVTIEPFLDAKGRHAGFAKITRDMTAEKEQQDKIAETGRRLNTALTHMRQGLCLYDAEERLILHNRRFLEIYGFPADCDLVGMKLNDLIHAALSNVLGHDPNEERVEIARQIMLRGFQEIAPEPYIADYPGLTVSVLSRAMADGGWHTTFDDITARRQSEARIRHMTMHDGLTGLPNRSRFVTWLDEHLYDAQFAGQRLAVIMLDLDGFKEINDSKGHTWGDAVLTALSHRLTTLLKEGEFVSRLGGDEFALAKIYTDETELAIFLDSVLASLALPATHEGEMVSCGGSLGVAIFPQDGDNHEALLNNAALAMHRAKSHVTEQLCYYDPSMDESARTRRQMAHDLRLAIDKNELSLVYQPQYNLGTGRLSGYEALLRWTHRTHGTVSPDLFIPIAEESGMIVAIGQWVLEHACTEAATWANDVRVAVNLSPVQLVQPNLDHLVTSALTDAGLSPKRLELEITETAIISDKSRALHNLRRIKAMGIAIAIDDFGTGYSSLDTLHSFPFDKIKIDKSFLLDSGENPQSMAIVRAVIALGYSLGVPVLAEGVETSAQHAMLIAEGCHEDQGYYLGRPAPAPSSTCPQNRACSNLVAMGAILRN